MNVAIISKNKLTFAEIAHKSFDDMNIVAYDNVNDFLDAINSRNIEIHRMLLTSDAIDEDAVTEDDANNFMDIIDKIYPSMTLITFSKDVSMAEYLSVAFNNMNTVHFCLEGIKVSVKLITDSLSLSVQKLNIKYKNIIFKKEVKVETDDTIMDGGNIFSNSSDDNSNESVPGYIPPMEPPKKDNRGLFGKLFGRAPKKSGKLITENAGKAIGQGQGVSEFSQGSNFYPEENNFINRNSEDEEYIVDNNFENPFENSFDGNLDDDDSVNYSIFDAGEDIGLGLIENKQEEESGSIFENNDEDLEEDKKIRVNLEKDDYEEPIKVNLDKNNDDDLASVNLNKDDVEDNIFDFDIPEDTGEESNKDINIPVVDISSMKEDVEQFNFRVSRNNGNAENVIPDLDLTSVGNEELDLFGNNLEAMMHSYEESNKKVVEKVVERIVHVGDSTSKFRNKNGVKILIVTGDRRIGSTQLALNLANIYGKQEKVLYVDFDRYRHGSLGYLNLDEILEEPEHIQNGIEHLKSLNILSQVVHLNRKGNFYTLTSMYGSDFSDEIIKRVQSILTVQKNFSTVIVDCPLDTLNLLTDIMRNASVLMCVEDNYVGIVNMLNMLSTYLGDEALNLVYDKGYFVVGRRGKVDKFRSELDKAVTLFGIDETLWDWRNIEILGVLKDTVGLSNRVGG